MEPEAHIPQPAASSTASQQPEGTNFFLELKIHLRSRGEATSTGLPNDNVILALDNLTGKRGITQIRNISDAIIIKVNAATGSHQEGQGPSIQLGNCDPAEKGKPETKNQAVVCLGCAS